MTTLDSEGIKVGTFLYDQDGDSLQTFKLHVRVQIDNLTCHISLRLKQLKKKQTTNAAQLIFCSSEPSAECVQVREAAREEQLGTSSLLVRLQPAGPRARGEMSCSAHRRVVEMFAWH